MEGTKNKYEENSRLDRIEHHLKLLKDNEFKNSQSLNKIENAIIGTEFNGHKGIVSLLDALDRRVEALEQSANENNVYVKQFKFVLGILFVGFVGLIYGFIRMKVGV